MPSSPPTWSRAYAHMVGVLEGQSLPLGDRGQKLPSSRLEEALDRPSRDAHLLGRLFLLLAFEVTETHRLQFVQAEFDDFQLR
jgi:hypothetical protein